MLARVDADMLEVGDHMMRRVVRDVIEANPPGRAVDVMRRWLDDADREYFRHRVEALGGPPRLPDERVPSLEATKGTHQ